MMIDRQWKLVNEQHGGVNVTDWILNRVYRKKNWALVCWIIHSFAAPFTYIIFLQPPQRIFDTQPHLCFMQQNRPYDQLPQRLVTVTHSLILLYFTIIHSFHFLELQYYNTTTRVVYILGPCRIIHRKISSWLEHYHFS